MQRNRLTSLRNIGSVTAQWLETVGIHDRAALVSCGAVEAYRRVHAAYEDRVTLNLLYALHGAIFDIHWNELPEDIRAALRCELGEGERRCS